jgi:DNA-binding NarL/FixJ family response regulator
MRLKIYTVENQEIFTAVYRSVFTTENGFKLMGTARDMTYKPLKEALATLRPDVLLIGTRALTRDLIATVQEIRTAFPAVGNVLLFDTFQSEGIKLLSRLATSNEAGMAVFLKRSLERIDQLLRITISVSERHFILDPCLTNLIFTEKHMHMILKGLTARELEILSLVAEGHTNQSIAEALYIDIKTVRHHINSIYGKLKADTDFNRRHPRVNATRLYLETTGDLTTSGNPAK